jgi:hypothetical protein
MTEKWNMISRAGDNIRVIILYQYGGGIQQLDEKIFQIKS